jgi:hypothetical protein
VTPPTWILDVLAGVMLAVAGVSAGRLAAARRGTAVTDTGHLLMAIAMAGTLAAGLRTLPSRLGRHLRRPDELVRLPGRAGCPRQRGPRPSGPVLSLRAVRGWRVAEIQALTVPIQYGSSS